MIMIRINESKISKTLEYFTSFKTLKTVYNIL